MKRVGLFLAIAVGLQGSMLWGQEWADKMFSELKHDFGAVPRAAKVQHRFVLTNLYKEEIHVAAVRSSCGCTTPTIENDTLKTREQGAVVATFNTDRFIGQRGATLTVTIDRPYYAEVRLRVDGYIRTDVVLNPTFVSLGSIDRGTAAEQSIEVQYAGRSDWKITEVKSDSPHLAAEVKETLRQNGRVNYQLTVKLADGAPAGYVREKLRLMTNGAGGREVPVTVEGVVVPTLAVSPTALHLGVVEQGQTVSRQLVVRARKPFRITGADCTHGCLTCQTDDQSKTVHLVPVQLAATAAPGALAGTLRIETDLGTAGVVELPFTVQIAPTAAAASTAAASEKEVADAKK